MSYVSTDTRANLYALYTLHNVFTKSDYQPIHMLYQIPNTSHQKEKEAQDALENGKEKRTLPKKENNAFVLLFKVILI